METEKKLISFFEEMFARQEYLIPLVAASFQYPMHYYGMTSAALLEDIFVDAAINFRNSHKRDIQMSRPEKEIDGEEVNSKGIKGWDYKFEGEHFSHKVGKGISAIALLWDATVEIPADKKWNYENTMVYVLSNYKRSSATIIMKGAKQGSVQPASAYRNREISNGLHAILVERKTSRNWLVHKTFELKESQNLTEALSLDRIWDEMTALWSKSSANKFDLFIASESLAMDAGNLAGKVIEFDFIHLPGIYLFRRELLQEIEVSKNNRAILLPASTVAKLAREAMDSQMFVFTPIWYMAYAENRPADLYLAQKKEFEMLNSASRRRG